MGLRRKKLEKTLQEMRKLEEARSCVTQKFIGLANYDFTEGFWNESHLMLQINFNLLTDYRPDLRMESRPEFENLE